MSAKISAVICTRNRVNYLQKALNSLINQTLDKENYEIIVVDNGSTDETRHVVKEKYSYVTNLSYIYEPILGLSQARNTALSKAGGQYIAYLDDDAFSCPGWLEIILHTFETVRPRPGCLGGRIEPVWEIPRPEWLPDNLLGSLTIVDWSDKPVILNEEQWIAGANMAFPCSLLKNAGGFETALGRKGKRLMSNEEKLLKCHLEKMGYQSFYHPEMLVWHHVPAGRLTKKWLMKRNYWQGVSDAITMFQLEPCSIRQRLVTAASCSITLLKTLRGLINFRTRINSQDDFTKKCSIYSQTGFILGVLGVF